jgi:alkanesulfonate monooxygenase SsuD/methylene tetrahydromethanopterin reductase-like flavin-dependent oxidoreductase (luciferase family)
MRFLLEPPLEGDLDGLVEAGRAVHAAGLDGVLVTRTPSVPAPLVAAAALASAVPDIRIAAEVEVGDDHPFEIAEEAAVVDVASGGRLILVVRPAAGREDRVEEALDLLRTAFAARPFRFEGPTWRVPANLPQNTESPERRVRIFPSPAQPRLEIWGAEAARAAALARGLGYLAAAGDDPEGLAAEWTRAESALGRAAIGAVRARREPWSGAVELVARLRAGRELFDEDWAVVAAPADAARAIASKVRPRVAMGRLPEGLEAFWEESIDVH